jgi:glycosyltransferase involved in cell wall biosynthesis
MAARALIAPSKFVSNWHAAHGIPSDKLQVIPHGLDAPPPQPKYGREPEVPIRFAFIGGLSWQKGVHILLEAFKEIESEAELWIAGDETVEPDYVSALKQLAPANVRFLGKLPREAVWDTLNQVDVVVVPSMWYETFSFIVSEAFAAGVPVVASRLGPLAERVRDGVDGLLVPPGDAQAMRRALLRFLQEPELLLQLQQGIPPVRTLDDHVAAVESLYLDVTRS